MLGVRGNEGERRTIKVGEEKRGREEGGEGGEERKGGMKRRGEP